MGYDANVVSLESNVSSCCRHGTLRLLLDNTLDAGMSVTHREPWSDTYTAELTTIRDAGRPEKPSMTLLAILV